MKETEEKGKKGGKKQEKGKKNRAPNMSDLMRFENKPGPLNKHQGPLS